MREIVVVSGKGGSGKTSVTAALASLLSRQEKIVLCDYDVDAPDMHILAQPSQTQTEDFISGNIAQFNSEACADCQECLDYCQFGAISRAGDEDYRVDESACEGCKACVALCPMQAFEFVPRHCGYAYVSQTRFGPFVHAQLTPGGENSGRLITVLKQKAAAIARQEGIETILSDGTPGIGCPVISSLSGASLVIIVTEATPSGLSDFERIAALCAQFRLPFVVIVNKTGLNDALKGRLYERVAALKARVVGELPFTEQVTESMLQLQTLTEFGGAVSEAMESIWHNTEEFLQQNEKARRRTIAIKSI